MHVELVRPPTLRMFVEAGCDVTTIPGLENYARIIVIGQAMPWPVRAKLALSYHETAEAWLRGEEASPFGPDLEVESTPACLQHYLWLAEGLMEEGVAELFAAALPDDLLEVCLARIAELKAREGDALD
jgi:hypothetical protein